MADDVRRGLTRFPKTLPPYLFYDEAGSSLYERITELPEYYLTRAEREIFVTQAAEIVDRVGRSAGGPLSVIELGAGSASKTEILLQAVLARHGRGLYLPIDVSATALAGAEARADGDPEAAAELFAHAAAAASEIGLTHHVALGYELAGRSLIDADDLEGAQIMLTASRDAYQRWGALAKVADVDQTLTAPHA